MNDRGVTIRYKGEEITTLPVDGELRLLTKERYMEDDVDIEVNRDETLISKSVTQNGTYDPSDDDADGYSELTVDVPNSYTLSDEGKVVSSGELVSQTGTTKNANGTYDTTLNDEVVVNVPNSYSAADEGKVVDNGALVLQTSTTKTSNGTYDTTFNNEVIVNVDGGIQLIAQADWDAMTKEEKWAYGLVAIQSEVSGYERGILVNGADYKPAPTLVYSVSRNGNSLGSLSYTFSEAGTYQIIGAYVIGGTNVKQEITFELNGNAVSASYSYPSQNNNVALNLFTLEIEASENDVITMTNTATYPNSGMQLFVIKDADINNIDLYDSRGNNGQTFNISIDGYYLQVSQFGYYQNNNNFVLREIDNAVKTSTPTPNNTAYWYGGMYVLTL